MIARTDMAGLESTKKLTAVTSNVNECAVVVCNEDKLNPETFKWKRREDNVPMLDQHIYLGAEISKHLSWDTHKGLNEKMDAIQTDSHIHTKMIECILVNVIVPGQDYAGKVWDADIEFVKQMEVCRWQQVKTLR